MATHAAQQCFVFIKFVLCVVEQECKMECILNLHVSMTLIATLSALRRLRQLATLLRCTYSYIAFNSMCDAVCLVTQLEPALCSVNRRYGALVQ